MKLFVLGLLFFLLSCASESSKVMAINCMQVDWQKLGKNDAMQGKRLSPEDEKCEGLMTSENKATYSSSYKLALKDFCAKQNAIAFAFGGGVYRNTCPVEKHATFASEYDKAKKIFFLNRQIALLESEIQRLQAKKLIEKTNVSDFNIENKVRQKQREKATLENDLIRSKKQSKFDL